MAILWLFLSLGTVWLGLVLFNFRQTKFIASWFRILVSDYALAIAVLVFSFIGSGGFEFTKFKPFYYDASQLSQIGVTKLVNVTPAVVISSML